MKHVNAGVNIDKIPNFRLTKNGSTRHLLFKITLGVDACKADTGVPRPTCYLSTTWNGRPTSPSPCPWVWVSFSFAGRDSSFTSLHKLHKIIELS